MTALKNTQDLPPQYQRLRQKLSRIGWIALGSLVERDQPGQGGPRYQWSRRVGPKTVTVALSAEQFDWLKQAISNQRDLGHTPAAPAINGTTRAAKPPRSAQT